MRRSHEPDAKSRPRTDGAFAAQFDEMASGGHVTFALPGMENVPKLQSFVVLGVDEQFHVEIATRIGLHVGDYYSRSKLRKAFAVFEGLAFVKYATWNDDNGQVRFTVSEYQTIAGVRVDGDVADAAQEVVRSQGIVPGAILDYPLYRDLNGRLSSALATKSVHLEKLSFSRLNDAVLIEAEVNSAIFVEEPQSNRYILDRLSGGFKFLPPVPFQTKPDIDREEQSVPKTPGGKLIAPSVEAAYRKLGLPHGQIAAVADLVADDLAARGYGVTETKAPVPPEAVQSDPMPIPTKAPEIYGGLRGPETPPEFVKRVYAPWLGQGLDRAHIKHLDPKLYTAIDNWTRKPGNEWPADVDLPTRGAQTRRTIEQLKQEAPDGRIGKVLGDFTAREAQRIRAAVRRQEQKR